jgi:hypothetical protein
MLLAVSEESTTTTPHRRPRWVKVSVIIVGILVSVFVILQLTGIGGGLGDHGPGRHGGGGDPPPSSIAEDPDGGEVDGPPPGVDHDAGPTELQEFLENLHSDQ